MFFMNPLDKAIQLCGGPSALAKQIHVTSARLGNWRVRGVPIGSCFLIEQATAGQVSRKDLRPDDWHKIWPELVAVDPGHAGRQPPTTNAIFDTVPLRAAVGIDVGAKP
jgi:DNA-binding transcriptional regulator YdaS (Cro superfamily)